MEIFNVYSVGFILLNCHWGHSINHGLPTTAEKRYAVYLTKAEKSPVEYDNWICGGAIVTESMIITSAACVEDVQYMYAIAGYHKYLKPHSVGFNVDECIAHSKKKIVYICLPSRYDFDYEKTDKWSYIDIAAVQVESAYDFNKPIHATCSWIPNAITISYDRRHTQAGTDAIALGWGSIGPWRRPNETKDYNSDVLQYASVRLANKADCIKAYKDVSKLHHVIERYMICTIKAGSTDDKGNIVNPVAPTLDGCKVTNGTNGTNVLRSNECDIQERYLGYYYYDGFRRNVFNGYFSFKETNITAEENKTENGTQEQMKDFQNGPSLRRHGICQNDHGGPLTTWVGTEELLIGTASVFLVNSNESCVGPFLFTSTQCTGAFLGCVLGVNTDDDVSSIEEVTERPPIKPLPSTTPTTPRRPTPHEDRTRRLLPEWFNMDMCNLPPTKLGFEIIKRRISWLHHPDGPAKNEMSTDLFERPQVPLSSFNNPFK